MVEVSEVRMPELQASVPLAEFDTDEWAEFSDFQSSRDANCNEETVKRSQDKNDNDFLDNISDTTDTFKDTFSTSLEDLVNTFDEKITKCFCNYEDKVEKYAPVQIRSQEEIMNECQMWWTITGNFGNILPIDWSKTYARQKLLPVLNLNECKESLRDTKGRAEDEEEVAQDLDLHHLILTGLSQEPIKSADEVIKEIDDIMQEGSDDERDDDSPTSSTDSSPNTEIRPLPPPLYEEKLNELNTTELNEVYMELELVIRQYSETLINQLALRDELEYEKELKNTFISRLLQVQNKRRNYNVEKKKLKKVTGTGGLEPKYLTTVIPYDVGHGPPSNQTLQILIKILAAINEDSPTVPTLLTDYILKVLCPS